ncbi:MAG: hypothetical protein J6A12_06965 [Oscillospiraceae bacterium]|nr:hypothetical protein [Oscillospiraceae bacterium]
MKKIISVFLAVAMLLSFSACSQKDKIVVPEEEMIESESEIKTESEPEQTESIEKIPESYIKIENGKLSGMIHPMVPVSPERENVFENELVEVSMSVPEGWEPGTLEEKGDIFGITFTMPWDERFETYLLVYKDDGTVYDYFYDQYSWGLKISDHTFNEVFGNFSKGVYIRVDGPSKNLGDSENWFLSSQWFYVLQFDGYVVVLHQNVRLNDDYIPFSEHEKACNDFASSIIIG